LLQVAASAFTVKAVQHLKL